MGRLLPWWTEPFFQKSYYRRTAGRLSPEETATLSAITRLFIFLLLGWLVLEVAGVALLRASGTVVPPWVRAAALVATPVIAVCAALLARRVVAARYPERTAVADVNAATRRMHGTGA